MELVKSIELAMRGNDSKVIAKAEKVAEEAFMLLKENHEHDYNRLSRDMHEVLYGPHYTEETAEEDVAKLKYTDAAGVKHEGPHWTKAEILDATKSLPFPNGTTDCDKYVAYNAAYADFSKKFADSQILDIAYLFYFTDEDWNGSGKIWRYMKLNQ